MTVITFTPNEGDSVKVSLEPQESVLKGLLRSGIDVPYGCQAGACQSCMMKSNSSEIPLESQQGLKPTQQALGYFLSCQCYPNESLTVEPIDISIKDLPR